MSGKEKIAAITIVCIAVGVLAQMFFEHERVMAGIVDDQAQGGTGHGE